MQCNIFMHHSTWPSINRSQLRHHRKRYTTALLNVLEAMVPLDHYVSLLKTPLPLSSGFVMVSRPFIHPLQIPLVAGPFTSIPGASFGSSRKELYPRCPIRSCYVSILGAVYDQLCLDYRLSESEKIYRLPWYCEFFTGIISRFWSKERIGLQLDPNRRESTGAMTLAS